MKAKLPQPVHESYLKHRRQAAWQIVLPVALTALIIVALIVLVNVATFNQGGDVVRKARIISAPCAAPSILRLPIDK